MKTKKSIKYSAKKKRRFIYATLLLAGLLALGAVLYFALAQPNPQEANNDPSSTTDKNMSGDDPHVKDEDRDIKEEPDTPVSDTNATFSIASLQQEQGQIHVVVDGTELQAGGICTIYLTSNSEQIVSEYLTVTETSSGIRCETLIPEVKFNYFGEWAARITYITPSEEIIETQGKLTISQ